MRRRFLALLAALLFALPGRAFGPSRTEKAAPPAGAWQAFYSGLPKLPDLPKNKAYALRVVYLEDDRLPTLKPEELRELYHKVEDLLQNWYGYNVTIVDQGRRPLSAYFLARNKMFDQPLYADALRSMELDVDSPEGRKRLLAAIDKDFAGRDLSQLRSYLGRSDIVTKPAAVRAAAGLFLRKLQQIRALKLPDGSPFYDKLTARLTSFPHWATMLYEVDDADFILTNSMLVSADQSMPIYVIIRGGITTGMVDNNVRNPYRAAGMVGLMPFLSNAPYFMRERGLLPKEERLDVIATFWMHELGHFFLHAAEAYDHPHCVHVAPRGLQYVGWHYDVRQHGPCTKDHPALEKF